MPQPSDHQNPIRPIRIHQNITVGPLNEKRGMTDPGDTDLPMFGPGKNRNGSVPVSAFAGKKGGEENVRDETMGTRSTGRRVFRAQGDQYCDRVQPKATAREDGFEGGFFLGSPDGGIRQTGCSAGDPESVVRPDSGSSPHRFHLDFGGQYVQPGVESGRHARSLSFPA